MASPECACAVSFSVKVTIPPSPPHAHARQGLSWHDFVVPRRFSGNANPFEFVQCPAVRWPNGSFLGEPWRGLQRHGAAANQVVWAHGMRLRFGPPQLLGVDVHSASTVLLRAQAISPPREEQIKSKSLSHSLNQLPLSCVRVYVYVCVCARNLQNAKKTTL